MAPRQLACAIGSTLLFALLNAVAAPAPAPAGFLGQPECLVAPLEPAPAGNKLAWNGQCKDGYAEGKGVLKWTSIDKHDFRLDAVLARGQVSGEGKLTTPQGVYIGTLRNGVPHGQGYFEDDDGDQYEGGFVAGKREGEGIFLDAAGGQYQGAWKGGKRHGTGSETFASGGSYKGEWKDGKFHGKGLIVYAGSTGSYEGRFEEGKVAGTAPRAMAATATPILTARAGRLFLNDQIVTVAVDPTAGWSKLTVAEQDRLKAWYPALAEGDEPPYPEKGPEEMYRAIHKIYQDRDAPEGHLSLLILVGADGTAKSVKAIGKLEANLTKPAATVAGLQRYKPAVCRGKPCEMMYMLSIKFTVRP